MKCPDAAHHVDLNARNVFYKGCSSSLLKCVYAQNMYGCRDEIINKDKINQYCPRCNEIETWEHVIQCPRNQEKNKKFILSLYKKLKKLDKVKAKTKSYKHANYLNVNL